MPTNPTPEQKRSYHLGELFYMGLILGALISIGKALQDIAHALEAMNR